MASVCFYFQVHQPCRLRRYSVFDSDPNYFDDDKNAEILRRVAAKCYLPANACMLGLIQRHERRFKIAYSLTGVILDQLSAWCPEVIESFQKLADTGCVEFLAETSHHSLAFLYSHDEFVEQVAIQRRHIESLFGRKSTVFRNTELIFHNDLAAQAHAMGFRAILAEGTASVLGGATPNAVYRSSAAPILVLPKNFKLSDDIAFRFSARNWPEWPLTAGKFAKWIDEVNGNGYTVNLFMDYETLGEHQWSETGIFDFFNELPTEVLRNPRNDFKTPGEIISGYEPVGEFDSPFLISWADTERDVSAWLGNAMQSSALQELYALEGPVKSRGDAKLLDDWRKLQGSDHFYYMCTKYHADGDVHRYFSPYESPYDSYINFMNVLDNLKTRTS